MSKRRPKGEIRTPDAMAAHLSDERIQYLQHEA
jgi:hypothetical protein